MSGCTLLWPLVHLGQKTPEHFLLQTSLFLIDLLNQSNDLLIAFLLVLFESLWDRDRCLGEEFLNAGFAVAVLSAIVFIEDLTLFRGGMSEGGVDVPRAFVVLQCRVKICLNMCPEDLGLRGCQYQSCQCARACRSSRGSRPEPGSTRRGGEEFWGRGRKQPYPQHRTDFCRQLRSCFQVTDMLTMCMARATGR